MFQQFPHVALVVILETVVLRVSQKFYLYREQALWCSAEKAHWKFWYHQIYQIASRDHFVKNPQGPRRNGHQLSVFVDRVGQKCTCRSIPGKLVQRILIIGQHKFFFLSTTFFNARPIVLSFKVQQHQWLNDERMNILILDLNIWIV